MNYRELAWNISIGIAHIQSSQKPGLGQGQYTAQLFFPFLTLVGMAFLGTVLLAALADVLDTLFYRIQAALVSYN